MTQVFHQLRSRSRALAQGLLLVLLATWLSAACAHCLDQADLSAAAPAPEASTHCHGDTAPPPAEPQSNGHDCCQPPPACTGGDCAQMSAVETGEPLGALLSETTAPGFVAADFLSYAYPSTPPPAAPDAHTVVFDSCPLYLRHCTFLN